MHVMYVVLGIVILLILIMVLRWNTFVSLIITSCLVALMLGMPVTDIVAAIEVLNWAIWRWYSDLAQCWGGWSPMRARVTIMRPPK
ncbi:GntT/GntP/DsdX family permease [Klebsiella pneumoniae]|uniref:GntT/GntP/DsdX family permease n=1 Tax=Klebsiella pneumoniae TaxID=573 RepID=UPI003F90D253